MFLQDSWQAVQKIEKNGRLPLVCGGTALYLRVMKYGIFPQANDGGVVRRELQKSVEVLGLQSLWQMLHDIDAGYAQKIGPNDQKRIIRALEIYKINGIPPSEIFKQTATPFQYYQFIRIGLNLDREVLYQRINQRVDEMIKNGLINEIERLRQRYPASCPPFASVGYKEIIQFLQGQMDLHSAVDLIKQHTRNYAKRQLSWFRQEKDIHWFEPGQQQKMADFIKEQIGH
jgi:tRNA dimethylallyltransferase